jgi:tetratricopeptide (TPR) repeat protein
VLDAVDELSGAVRRDLGESLQKISESKPLTAATTQSLEALQQYSLGVEKHRSGQVQGAKAYFENALNIEPTFTTARASLGMLHMDQAAMGIPHFDAEVGKRLLTEAIQHIPNLTDKEKYTALAFYAQWVEHDLEKAVSYHRAIIAIYPENPVAYSNLSWVYNRAGRYEEAIAAARQAIRIDPRLLIAYANLAGVQLYQQGDVKSALETCEQELQVDPRNAWAHDCVGWALFGKGDWAQAQPAFEKAVMFNPQNTLSRYRLSHAHRLQGHYREALQTLEPILCIDPSDASPWYDMGVVYEAMGDHKKSREHFEHFRREMEAQRLKNPREADAEWSLAAVLSRLGQRERAWFWARKALALDPSRHFEYATILSLNQHKREAIEELQTAIQKGYRHYIFIKIHPDLVL